jgi:hypothetical protein
MRLDPPFRQLSRQAPQCERPGGDACPQPVGALARQRAGFVATDLSRGQRAVSRLRFVHLETHDGLIRSVAAISRFVSPASFRASARSRRSTEYGAVIHAGLQIQHGLSIRSPLIWKSRFRQNAACSSTGTRAGAWRPRAVRRRHWRAHTAGAELPEQRGRACVSQSIRRRSKGLDCPRPRLSPDHLAKFAKVAEGWPNHEVDGGVRWRWIDLKRTILTNSASSLTAVRSTLWDISALE